MPKRAWKLILKLSSYIIHSYWSLYRAKSWAVPWLPHQATFFPIPSVPSTYSITMHKWRLVSKEQNMLTTKGFSAKVSISRSTKACWIWFRRIRFCLLIFFMAKRCRVDLCRTKNTALRNATQLSLQRLLAPELCIPLPELPPHTLHMYRTREQGGAY